MREMNPFNFYQVANIFTVNANGQTQREPEFWAPETIDINDHNIQYGHRAQS